MEKAYTIYASKADEANEGWMWFLCPDLPTRTVVRVHNRSVGRVVYCQSRKIDKNFLRDYKDPSRIEITKPSEAAVINGWYRDALGISGTTHETNATVGLEITRAKVPGWRAVRAACHHPDIVARVGTRLGIVGTWLGLVGLAPLVMELFCVEKTRQSVLLMIVAAIGAILGIRASWGTKTQ